MRINNLKLKYYRNHKNYSVEFEKNLVIVNGANGAGKTNLLEAIYLLATAKSSKASYDRDLINYDHDFCTIAGNVSLEQDEYDLELQIIKSETFEHAATKKAKVNKVAKSISGFTGIFNAVMFAPEDMEIISGTPAERRRFMDLILYQTSRTYKKNHSEYTKAIRQRNKILELINETGQGKYQIDYWTDKITELGTAIQIERDKFFSHAKIHFATIVKDLNHSKALAELTYKKSEISKSRLEQYKDREIAAKTTLIGPHRDDFSIDFNGHDVAEFGSRGQQRTILLSLKLLEIDFIEKEKGERPVLLLDDIFSELDEPHRQAVIETVSKQQTFISSAENISHLLPSDSQLIIF